MDLEMFFGRCMETEGRVQELLGRLTHNELRRMTGAQLAIRGRMRIAGAFAEGLLRQIHETPTIAEREAARRVTLRRSR